MKHILTLICCVMITAGALAQKITGNVTDSVGKAVPFANITLKAPGNLIIAFTSCTDKGAYNLPVPADAPKDGLMLEVSCVGFNKASKPVTAYTAPYNFTLKANNGQLKAITVKSGRPHLKVSGDTISYKVSDFSNPQDRVIGDVIKKLPGMDVDKSGKISYNGKAISNLYIGGDNLLDDKYNIATNNIPNGVVDQVQVMENHQPVKMLKDKVVSDDVALNLTIKKEAKLQLVGQETVGGGLPGKYYEDLNAMMFKDKYKAINYLKGNNTGNDVAYDLISHNFSDYMNRIDNQVPGTVLSLGTAGDPDLPRNRYLFNQAGIVNLNNLVNVKKDMQLRANISYLHDTQKQDYQKNTSIFLPNETIQYSEYQHNRRQPDLFHSQLLLNINKDKYYLNNSLVTDYSHNTSYSDLTTNGVNYSQVFRDNTFNFSNEFNLMNTLRSNRIIEVYSYINRLDEPENRIIAPNFEPDIFNKNVPYSQLVQNVSIPTWFTNNYVSFKLPSTNFTQSYKAGLSLQSQTLQSALTTVQTNGSEKLGSDSTRNNLDWTRRKIYAQADYDVPGQILKVTVSLPLTLQNLSYRDPLFALDKSLTRLYFNPRVNIKYQSGVENYFTLGYSLRNDMGTIQDIYAGDILVNYRSLYANNADLSERKTQAATLGFNYRKALTLFFFGVNTSYIHTTSNNISSSIINNNIQQRIVLPFENSVNSYTISGNISKYVFSLRTTVSAGAGVQASHSNQFYNGILLPYNTISTALSAGFDTKINNQVNLSYKASYNQVTSKSSAQANSAVLKQLQQQGSVNYNPSDRLFIKLSGDHYFTQQTQANDLSYVFADATARYKFNKPKIDIELSANNLFDTRTYNALYLSANTFTSNSYTIPGRYFLVKLFFNI
ncbi:TonB-dependent receptor [Mucilaginibacter sp. AW1-3]